MVLDRTVQELLHGADEVNVFETVMELRHHRVLIVQAEEQYIYIHECLLDAIEDEIKKRDQTNQGIFAYKGLFFTF